MKIMKKNPDAWSSLKGNQNRRTTGWAPPGMSRHYLYNTYVMMLNRCYNSRCKAYKNYGARGITVCDRWLPDLETKDGQGFLNFIADVGDRPGERLRSSGYQLYTLGRKDNNGNYEPNNVRWETHVEQRQNQRTVDEINN